MVSLIKTLISSLLQYCPISMISDYGPTLWFSSKSDSASDDGVLTIFFRVLYLGGGLPFFPGDWPAGDGVLSAGDSISLLDYFLLVSTDGLFRVGFLLFYSIT